MFWVWAIAYLIAGAGFVAKDQFEPPINQPFYIQTRKGRWLVRLFWPLVSVRILLLNRRFGGLDHQYFGGQFLPTWFLFVAIGAIGTLLVNWIFG